MVVYGTSQRAFIDPFAECLPSPTACSRTRSGARRPLSGSPCSPSRRRSLRSRSLASTGSLMAQRPATPTKVGLNVASRLPKVGVSGATMCKDNLQYDYKRGVTSNDLYKRQKNLEDLPRGQWRQNERDLPAEVSDKLEKAFIAGELRCGVWDNGLFRDFDLAKMQEIPGLRELKRVQVPAAQRPWTTPSL